MSEEETEKKLEQFALEIQKLYRKYELDGITFYHDEKAINGGMQKTGDATAHSITIARIMLDPEADSELTQILKWAVLTADKYSKDISKIVGNKTVH